MSSGAAAMPGNQPMPALSPTHRAREQTTEVLSSSMRSSHQALPTPHTSSQIVTPGKIST